MIGSLRIFEAGMLFCFGFAWPANIYKSLTTRTAKGRSLTFQVVILLGYISGIINKLLYSRDIVLVLYIINLLMVSFDTVLYFRNKRLDVQRDTRQDAPGHVPVAGEAGQG